MYGSPIPSATSAAQHWRCPACTSSNHATAAKCSSCGRPAPGGGSQNNTPVPSRGPSASPFPPSATSAAAASSSYAAAAIPSAIKPASPPPFSGPSPLAAVPSNNSGTRTPPPGPVVVNNNPLQSNSRPGTPPPLHQQGTGIYSAGGALGGPSPAPYTPPPPPNNNNGAAAASVGRRSPTPSAQIPYSSSNNQNNQNNIFAGGMHPMERKAMEQEIQFLRNAVHESKKFGIEIENTVEYLTDLLRRKTLECESLRTLATENYDPVRHAIQEQYKAQKRVEKNAQNELKFFQGRIETLYAERTTLLGENQQLKKRVSELERQVLVEQTKHTTRADDPTTLFNRITYGEDRDLPPYHMFRCSMSSGAIPLMQQLTGIPPKKTQMLKQIRAIEMCKIMLIPDIALRLHHFGFWSYMRHLLTVLIAQQKVDDNTFATSISESYKSFLRLKQNPPPPASAVRNQHFAEKLHGLYQTFMPDQVAERDALLSMHEGKEYDLWNEFIQPMAEYFEEREKALGSAEEAATSSSSARFRQFIEQADDEFEQQQGGGGGGGDDGSPSSSRRSRRNQSASPGGGAIDDETLSLHTRILLIYLKHAPEKFNDPTFFPKIFAKWPAEIILEGLLRGKGFTEPTGDEKKQLLEQLSLIE